MRFNQLRFLPARKIWIILLLGFASGLPLALISSTLTAWYTEANISLMSIGLLSLVGQPYVYKFFWAPLVDRYDPLKIGRRRSWMLISQIGVICSLFLMSQLHPASHPLGLAMLAFCTAIFSATQDIAISAYLAEAPTSSERGLASSFYMSSYRIALIVAGAGALILAQYYGWKITYLSMTLLMGTGLVATFYTPEPTPTARAPITLRHSFIEPLHEFFQRFGTRFAVLILIIMVIYKLTDAFALSLSSVFLLRTLHYSLVDVGLINKAFGTVAVIAGSLSAGMWMRRISLFKALVIFGLLQACANIVFIWLFYATHTINHLAIAICIDNFCSGLGNTAFLALIISLCAKEYAGTQFALLSAFTAIGRVYIGPIAAWVVMTHGWPVFFWISILIGLIGVLSLLMIRDHIKDHSLQDTSAELEIN